MQLCPHLLIPAYGRDYTTPEEVLADWEDGKDFKIVNGPYTSIRDWPDHDVVISFNRRCDQALIRSPRTSS